MDRGRERRIIKREGGEGKGGTEAHGPGGERMNAAGKSCGRDVLGRGVKEG